MKKLMLLPSVFLTCLFSLTLGPKSAVAGECVLNSDCPLARYVQMGSVLSTPTHAQLRTQTLAAPATLEASPRECRDGYACSSL